MFKMGTNLSFVLLLVGMVASESDDVKWSRLHKDVFEKYDAGVRPLCESSDPTNITLGVALRQILSLNAPSQEISINVWMRLGWKDCRLVWNETKYGLPHVQLPKDHLWIPDITVYDSSSGETLPGIDDFMAKIYSNGDVSYNWPSVISTFCKLQVRNFPMDKQVCKFIFTSWIYSGAEVDWLPMFKTGDLSIFQQNAEWDIIKYVSERHSAYYSCCPYPFVDLTFYLHMQRRPLHYILSLIFPCVLISALTLLGFLLPVESGEKVSLQITVMLSLAVFLIVISDHLPPSSDSAPLVGIYFAFTLGLVTLSCFVTVAVLHIHFKTSSRVPRWVRTYAIGKLGRILMVNAETSNEDKESFQLSDLQKTYASIDKESDNNNDQNRMKAIGAHDQTVLLHRILNHLETPAMNDNSHSSHQRHGFSNSDVVSQMSYDSQAAEVGLQLREHAVHLRKLAAHFDAADKDSQYQNEWRALAIVIDRIFFIICLAALVITTTILFTELGDQDESV